MSELSANDRRNLLRDAVRAVDEMKGKLEALERARTEPIAIIGIGCRYPGADGPDAFWHLLENGGDAVTEVPASRWTPDAYSEIDAVTASSMPVQRGGFLPQVDQFDPQFFGISPREAVSMDPQQRLVLEVSWEALEHACVSPEALRDSLTGVFLGITSSDYSYFLSNAGPAVVDVYAATGNSHNAAAGRLAYTLGLHGPALAIDSACSSSLVAVHLACQSLRSGDSDVALAGGVNCMLLPGVFLLFHKAAMTAPDGRCKVFDKAADGFVRAEGCGMVVLKRLSDAIAAGDRVLAVIRGSAVNQDGASSGLTVPNGPAQEAVIRRALSVAGVTADRIDFVEAHGTGTSLGDPIELEAIDAVLGEGRSANRPLVVGSAKANIGHTEAASGVAGLIKTVLALRQGAIPPQIHFESINPRITLRKTQVIVPTALTPWAPWQEARRLAGVSSFGLSGTNAHVIVEEAPLSAARPAPERDRPVHVLTLSAKTPEALADVRSRWQEYFKSEPGASAGDIAYSAGVGRSHFAHRLAVVGETVAEFGQALESAVSNRVAGHARRSVVFLFSGQGSQYSAMSRELYELQPTYRRAIDRCADILKSELDVPLVDLLFRAGENPARLDDTRYAQPALFSVEYALAELWQSWGVVPDAVMGHSVGEYVAACVAGVFSLEDALHLIAARGRLMQALPTGGAMAAVVASVEITEAAASKCGSRVEIAAVNAPSQTVVSGTRDDVAALIAALEAERVEARWLKTSHAFHSKLVEPMLEAFEAEARKVRFGEPAIDLISNITGLRAGAEVTQPRYWRDHARKPVKFLRGLETLRDLGHRLFLEVGPGSTLTGLVRQALTGEDVVCATSLRNRRPEFRTMAETVATLYAQGVAIDWTGFDRDYPRGKVTLPTYPFQRKRFWVDVQKPAQMRSASVVSEPWREWLHQYEWEQLPAPASLLQVRSASEIAESLQPDFESLCQRHDLEPYQHLQTQLSRVSASYVARACSALGWDVRPAGADSRAALMERAQVAPRFGRLVARMFGILEEDAGVAPDPDPDATLADLLLRYPEFGAEIGLMQVCGPRLADVLTGACDPIELLFPQGSLDRLERVYQESPGAKVFNALVGRAVAAALPAASAHRKIRILEIGAGTGSATTSILEVLDPCTTDYVFTDMSSVFTNRAKKKFAAYPFVDYRLLDISRPPGEQGFAPGQFDVIVAANVLHATPDLRQTLAHVSQLLAPQGALVLLEGTTRQRAIDLTFGLTEGWWSFTDTDLRPAHALLSAAQWIDLLSAHGFASADTFPPVRENPEGAIVVARMPRVRPASTRPVAEEDGWLVFADEKGYGDALASRVRASGKRALIVRRAASFEAMTPECRINPARPEDYSSVLQWACASHGIRRVVDLWPIDATLADGASPADVDESQRLSCGSTLWLVQALAALESTKALSLTLVTSGARAVGASPRVEAAQASVWGMGRVIAVEYPGLRCVRADLDPQQSPDAAAVLLLERLNEPGLVEDQIAFRGEDCFAARLGASAVRQTRPSALSFNPDATYLITGAFRGIGLLTARWMVDRGARRLLLIGRRSPEPEARAVFDSLEARGAALTVVQCDVGDREALRSVLDAIDPRFPLRGVIHSAGALDDAVLAHQTWDRFRNVMTAKVHGAWNLHELTRTLALDCFVLFSSAAASLASAGQANHAAVNAFMDAVAHRRRGMGLPALTINWGAWREVGAAERSGTVERLRARGVGSMAPEDGIAILEHLMGTNETQVLAIPLSVADVENGIQRDAQQSAALRETAAPAIDWRQRLAAAGEDQRTATVLACVLAQVGEVLRATAAIDPQQPLSDLGLDSLMAVELKNRLEGALGVTIPLAKILAGQSGEGLGLECLSRMDAAPRAATADTIAGEMQGQTVGPLSHGQQALWFLWNLAPDSAAYNVLTASHLAGEVSADALERALLGIVERHAVLRTTYPAVDGLPVRMVHASQKVTLERVDAGGWSDDELRARVAADADRPFDLQKGPILRATLYSRGSHDHVLAFTIHHIAFDDVSNRPLMSDFSELYSAARKGTAPRNLSSAGSFDDYVRWQSELVAGPESDRLWEYWRKTLAGDIAPLNLPTDRPRPAAQTFNGASFSFVLSDAVAGGIVRLARTYETTPYVVTAAAFAALLHRLSGQGDLLIGTPTAGRSRPEFSSVVGYFVNPLILRSDVSDDPAFSDQIVRVRETVLGALDHGDLPFPLLVERLQPSRDPSFSPLYQVGFVWDKVVRNDEAAGELAAAPWMAGQRGASADLGLTIFHDDRSMTGYWRYNTDLFDAETVRRFHGNFETLLAGAIAVPDRKVSELPILTESERHRLLVEWNDTAAPDTGELLHQLVERQAERTPGAIAVMFGDETLSYSELNRRANQLARALRSRGVGPEVRVGLAMERSLEMVVSLLAVLKAGGAYVPLDSDYPPERFAYMLDDSGVSLLLTQDRIRPLLADARVPVVAIDADYGDIDAESPDNLSLRMSPDHLAYVIYTSGSTGRPKGAMNAHRAIVNRLMWMQETYRLAADDRMLQKAPFSFDVSVWEFFWPLATGATLVMAPPGAHKDPEALVGLIARLAITTLHFVPSMLRMFLQAPGIEHCASLRRVFCGGEALSPAVRDALLSRTSAVLFNQYGPTETAVDVTYWPCAAGADAPIPIGMPGSNTQLYVVDQHMQPVPTGASGELCIGGVQVGRGYLGRPALTAERFVPDPFSTIPGGRLYRTGDRSRHRRDGAVEFLGRFDDQVKLRGIRIELGEIEAALLNHPAVAAAAVIARDEGEDDRRLVAYLVARGEQPSVEDVRRFLLASLPAYMAPASMVFLESLPVTASGKLDRRALPAPAAECESQPGSERVAPRTATEELVCRIWAEVLRVDRVGVRDNFFELGGHSLLATKVMSRLRGATGADLPLRAFFENATVEGLATAVVQHQARLADEDTLAKLLAEVE